MLCSFSPHLVAGVAFIQVSLASSGKPLQKHPLRHTQKYVSIVIFNPDRWAMKIAHDSIVCEEPLTTEYGNFFIFYLFFYFDASASLEHSLVDALSADSTFHFLLLKLKVLWSLTGVFMESPLIASSTECLAIFPCLMLSWS